MITAALAWLAGSRTALIAVVAALALSTAALGTQTLRLAWEKTDHADDKTHWAEQVANAEHQGRLDTEAAMIKGNRRFIEQEKITDAANIERDKKAADAATATAAGNKLRDTANDLARQLTAANANTATAELRSSTATLPGVLADMLGRVEQAGRGMATVATERGINGTSCERKYDALSKD